MDSSAPPSSFLDERWLNYDLLFAGQLDMDQDFFQAPQPMPSQLNTPPHMPGYYQTTPASQSVPEKAVASSSSSMSAPPPAQQPQLLVFGTGPAFQSTSTQQLAPLPVATLASVKEEDDDDDWMNTSFGSNFFQQVAAQLEKETLLSFRTESGTSTATSSKETPKSGPPPPPMQNNHPENPQGLKLYLLDPDTLTDRKFRSRVKSAIQSKKYRDEQKRLVEAPKCLGICKPNGDLLNQLKTLQDNLERLGGAENAECGEKVKHIISWLEGRA